MISDLELASNHRWTKPEAEAFCRNLAKTHYENFTVGSLFIPKNLRQHMYHIYAYCRWSDDLGDESGNPTDAYRRLEDWEKQLNDCYEGKATHPIFIALQETIQKFDVPKEPFWRLIQAFKQDQTKTRYETHQEVLGYCVNSANPVGHLVLYLFGYRDAERQSLSDKICTALQLANFWQDVKRDRVLGRIYIPRSDMKRCGVVEADLMQDKATPEFKNLLSFQVDRTRQLFYEGAPLIQRVKGMLRIDLHAFLQGGLAVLDAIQRINYDVLWKRPEVSRGRKLLILLSSFIPGKSV